MRHFLRRRRTDAESHALRVANAHAADLARQLAEAHETIRHLGAKADRYQGRNRELVAEVLNLKAAARTGGRR